MRIIKLILVSVLAFVVVSGTFFYTPSSYKHEVTDWFGRLVAPSLDVSIDGLTVRNQDDVIGEYKRRGYKLNCYGNLRPEESVGEHTDYACWGLIRSAFDDVPARFVTFYFYKKKLVHVRLEFPESAFTKVQNYLERKLSNRARLDSRPGSNFGTDNYGMPLMVWKVKEGVVVASGSPVSNRHVVVLWSSFRALILKGMKTKKLGNEVDDTLDGSD